MVLQDGTSEVLPDLLFKWREEGREKLGHRGCEQRQAEAAATMSHSAPAGLWMARGGDRKP